MLSACAVPRQCSRIRYTFQRNCCHCGARVSLCAVVLIRITHSSGVRDGRSLISFLTVPVNMHPSMTSLLKDQLSIVFGSSTGMHSAHGLIFAIEEEVTSRRSTSIEISGPIHKVCHSVCNAGTDDLVTAGMCRHIWHPIKDVIEVFALISAALAHLLQSVPRHLVE